VAIDNNNKKSLSNNKEAMDSPEKKW